MISPLAVYAYFLLEKLSWVALFVAFASAVIASIVWFAYMTCRSDGNCDLDADDNRHLMRLGKVSAAVCVVSLLFSITIPGRSDMALIMSAKVINDIRLNGDISRVGKKSIRVIEKFLDEELAK